MTTQKNAHPVAIVASARQQVLNDYNHLVQVAAIDGVHLIRTDATFHIERMPSDENGELQIITPVPECRVMREGRLVQSGSRLRLSLVNPKHPKQPVFEIVAEYIISYSVPEELAVVHQALLLFAERIGVFNTWPFFRELVHSTGTRAGLPQLMVPLLRLSPNAPNLAAPTPLDVVPRRKTGTKGQ